MGVLRGLKATARRFPGNHGTYRMFADIAEAGKGLYIGDQEIQPTFRQQAVHRKPTPTTSATTSDTRGRSWWSKLPEGTADSYKYPNYDPDQVAPSGPYDAASREDDSLQPNQYSPKDRLTDASSPSLYPDYQEIGTRYSDNAGNHYPHTGHVSLQRHNTTSLNSAPSSIHKDTFGGSLSSALSLPSSEAHTNLLEHGVDQGTTFNHLQVYNHAQHLDPVSPTMEVPFNFSDDCFNITSFDCWPMFDNMSDNASNGSKAMTDEDYKYWTILLIIFPLFTVFGNILVVLSVFKEKSLKTVTNYFICSLAIADIMVAVVVMPLAVYMEVVSNRWMLSDPLCDAWVASDVLACTASILNLTAISVDRFIAVTQPIKYAKHKNSKRVFIMLAITWVISVAIAAPIALGVNYSSERNVGDCRFFNSDFIIYSSMGSFYIPSIIMIFLYWKIYKVIRLRALKAKKAKRMRDVDRRALQGVIENPATTAGVTLNDTGGVYGASEATVTTGLAKMDNGRVTYNTTTSSKATTSRFLAAHADNDGSVTNVNSNSDDNSNDDEDDESPSGSGSANNNTNANDSKCLGVAKVVAQVNPKLLRNAEVAELITNPVAEEFDRLETAEKRAVMALGKNGGCAAALDGGTSASASTSGGVAVPCANEAETPFTSLVCKGDTSDNADATEGMLSPKKKTKRDHKKGVTKFNFHMRTSRKRKEKSSSKREKKATKTLAIVLGVFLVCWVPFFTLNIISAICIRYDLDEYPACNMNPIYISMAQWLGYINSFLNPVIYTIFNPEFRKAFRKLLTDPCR